MIHNVFDAIPAEQKDEILAALINQNQQILITVIEDAAGKQNVQLKLDSIFVQA